MVEVGPGLGALTVELATRVRAVVGVEIDPALVKALALILRDHSNVRIIEANVLRTMVADLLPAPYRVAGTVTYPSAHGVIGAATIMPLDHMLVETDSPFLPPQSRRGQANAPRYLVETVERIAALRGTTAAEIARATRQNTTDLFRLNHAV